MPVYMFTFHAYGSWMPDHPRGYAQRGAGILPPDSGMADRYRRRMKQPETTFTRARQRILVEGSIDIGERRSWRPHAVGTDRTHVHILMSWTDQKTAWPFVRDTLKRLLGMMLSQAEDVRGVRWFSRKGSRKRVRDRGHFEYLITSYLPDHPGVFWSERSGLRE